MTDLTCVAIAFVVILTAIGFYSLGHSHGIDAALAPATTISPRALAVATRLAVKRWGKERKKGNPGKRNSKWSKA